MNISIYCSANNDIAEKYYSATKELGEWMAKEHHVLVWGGGNTGLMGCISDTVHDNGGRTIGMVPRALEQSGRVSDKIDIFFPCGSLTDRKDLMIHHSDIAIALPGGIGTLDEIFTQAGGNTIGFHKKKVILYNVCGFYNTLISFLDIMQETGMIRGKWQDFILTADTLDDIKNIISEYS